MPRRLSTAKLAVMLRDHDKKDSPHYGKINPDNLTLHERKIITEYLREKTNLRQIDVADLLRVTRRTIISYEKQTHEIDERLLAPMNTDAAAKDIRLTAEKNIERALGAGDYRTAWKIKRELYETLGRMGFITWKSGDVVMGNKSETHVTSIQTNVLTENLKAVSPETRAIARNALVAAGLLKAKKV